MKKTVMVIMFSLFCVFSGGIASANFIANPSFESYTGDDFASWTEGGQVRVNTDPQFVYDGSASAFLRIPGGNLYQPFTITEGSSLYYGAWFRIATDSTASNWDQVQISLQIDSLPWTTIGGGVTNFIGVANFAWNPSLQAYVSDWFLIANTIPVASVPVNANINISSQNTDTELTKVFVDKAFAEHQVPEPTTLLLFGLGLVGLAGVRRFGR